MNTRPLTKIEAAYLSQLNSAGLESALIFLTETGLQKSILDATQPVRELLKAAGLHDYYAQKQGPSNKIQLPCVIIDGGNFINSTVSLYRPLTKSGDPRLWPYKLTQFAKPNDVLSIFTFKDKIYLLNLSDDRAVDLGENTDFSALLAEAQVDYNQVASELLFKLQALAIVGPLTAVCEGSTAIGRTIEQRLGIAINSRPLPDYKGIEIKTSRSASATRNTLFAKVPNWTLSEFKSSREIVEAFGYSFSKNPEDKKLYCSVSTQSPNSQGLYFDLDLDERRLDELIKTQAGSQPVCVWRLSDLHSKLLEKHAETFWVKASESQRDGLTYFTLESVQHTRRPSIQQFDRLLASGVITMDHLIKKTAKKTTEKGPLFKIRQNAVDELFLGRTQYYSLRV